MCELARYISIPCAPAPPSSLSLGFSATIASVVSIKDATLDAFCSAKRVTLVGSITPGLEQVLVLAALHVEAECGRALAHFVDDDGAFPAAVGHDPAQRL